MITITQETFNAEIAAEILPLAQKGWDESTDFKAETCAYFGERAFLIEPDVERYDQLSQAGLLILITLRDNSVLKGYILGFSYRSMHHRRIWCGIADAAYIEPECRAYTSVMAEKFETTMKAQGAEIIGWPTHINGPLHSVLSARGYVADDIVMEKRLKDTICALH